MNIGSGNIISTNSDSAVIGACNHSNFSVSSLFVGNYNNFGTTYSVSTSAAIGEWNVIHADYSLIAGYGHEVAGICNGACLEHEWGKAEVFKD